MICRRRRFAWGAAVFLLAMMVATPLEVAIVSIVFTHPAFMLGLTLPDTLGIAAALLLGSIALGLVMVGVIPRVLSRLIEPGKVYPLFGFHYALQRTILR